MKALLDTHVLLWIMTDDPALSRDARAAYTDRRTDVFFSVAGYWEMCIKISLGKLRLAPGWPDAIERMFASDGVKWLPVQPRHAEATIDLPWHHRDPFDRLLVAQCQTEELSLITADTTLAKYGIPVIW